MNSTRSKLFVVVLVSTTLLAIGNARADTYAIATDNIQNGLFSATAGVTFGSPSSNSSSAASLNGSGVSSNAVGPNPDAPISAAGSASGRANETAGPVYYTPIGSNGTNYSWGDAIISQQQTANTTLTARNAAETNIAGAGFANGSGVNTLSTPISVGNCPAGACTISFAFQADPFIQTAVDSGANAGSVARGTLGLSITLTSVSSGAIVFNWTPDGTLGTGIVGGVEAADPQNLNLTLAAFPGQSLTYSGPYAAGVFGAYAATTNGLAAGSYQLSFSMSERTDVLRLSSNVPEPSTWAMMILGFAGVGFMGYRKRKNGLALAA